MAARLPEGIGFADWLHRKIQAPCAVASSYSSPI
jgi:hypothetical protein